MIELYIRIASNECEAGAARFGYCQSGIEISAMRDEKSKLPRKNIYGLCLLASITI